MAEKEFVPDANAATFGSIAALQGVVAALVASHPDKAALTQALHEEHEQTMVYLLASPMREAGIECFDATWKALVSDVKK